MQSPGQHLQASERSQRPLTLATLHVLTLRSFVKFNKAPIKFNEALTKPCHGLIEILLYHSKMITYVFKFFSI